MSSAVIERSASMVWNREERDAVVDHLLMAFPEGLNYLAEDGDGAKILAACAGIPAAIRYLDQLGWARKGVAAEYAVTVAQADLGFWLDQRQHIEATVADDDLDFDRVALAAVDQVLEAIDRMAEDEHVPETTAVTIQDDATRSALCAALYLWVDDKFDILQGEACTLAKEIMRCQADFNAGFESLKPLAEIGQLLRTIVDVDRTKAGATIDLPIGAERLAENLRYCALTVSAWEEFWTQPADVRAHAELIHDAAKALLNQIAPVEAVA